MTRRCALFWFLHTYSLSVSFFKHKILRDTREIIKPLFRPKLNIIIFCLFLADNIRVNIHSLDGVEIMNFAADRMQNGLLSVHITPCRDDVVRLWLIFPIKRKKKTLYRLLKSIFVLYVQIPSTFNYSIKFYNNCILFKISALFFKYSWNFTNFIVEILLKNIFP